MTDLQLFISVGLPSFALLFAILLNNYRLNDVKELIRAEIKAASAESPADIAGLTVFIERNHSEMMIKFADLDQRLSRIENERRIVQ